MADDNFLRQSQIVTSFGPGALVDLPEQSIIVAGLSAWDGFRKYPVSEARLQAKFAEALGKPVRLYAPPPVDDTDEARRDAIAGRVFPTWFETQAPVAGGGGPHRRRRLVGWATTEKGRTYVDPQESDRKSAKKTLVPVRFVCGCKRGHIDDIDWRTFVHRGRTECTRALWMEERGTAGDVADVVAGCDCGAERRMYEAQSTDALGTCRGHRPWLGGFASEGCHQPNKLLVRTGSNTYFPERMTVISLPEGNDALKEAVERCWSFLENVSSVVVLTALRSALTAQLAVLAPFSDDAIWDAIEANRAGGAPDLQVSVKAAEFAVLASGDATMGTDGPDSLFFAETLTPLPWGRGPTGPAGIAGVVAVHRLREVTAQVGFTRIAPPSTETDGELDPEIEGAALDINQDWLPAFENRGEGVFVQLDAAAVADWQRRPPVVRRAQQLEAGFNAWKAARADTKRVFPGAAYILVHTFAHLLLTAIAEECGYPASSLRERVYALQPDSFGVLLYTSTPGADGTLGGLAASAWRMGPLIHRAIELASLCSNDPVCAHHDPDDGNADRPLHGAACHGCLFVSETSCEQRNDFLDRSLVVETVEADGAALFGPGR